MRHVLKTMVFLTVSIIAVFLLFGNFEEVAEKEITQLEGVVFAIVSGFLLVSDVLLPVPSSLIMILNGKVLGFVGGLGLSFAGGMAGALVGYSIGRGGGILARQWFERYRDTGDAFLSSGYAQYGVAASRAIPVFAEVVSITAGVHKMPLRQFLLFTSVGQLIVSAIYAACGTWLSGSNGNLTSVWVILAVLGASWFVRRLFLKFSNPPGSYAPVLSQKGGDTAG